MKCVSETMIPTAAHAAINVLRPKRRSVAEPYLEVTELLARFITQNQKLFKFVNEFFSEKVKKCGFQVSDVLPSTTTTSETSVFVPVFFMDQIS